MKIGVIADTHINSSSRSLPESVHRAFENVEMILHAGDVLIEEVLIELRAIAPVIAVTGNNDSFEMFSKYGKRRIIEVMGKKIGLVHGFGRGRTYINAYSEFMDDEIDCVVYGHSHTPHNEIIDGMLFFNPGSATQRRFQPKHSVGILHISEEIIGEIIYID